MTITSVMPFAYPATQFGGPVTQLEAVTPELARRGHDIRLVTLDLGIGDRMPRDQWVARRGFWTWYASTRSWHRIAPYWAPVLRRPLHESLADSDALHLQLGLHFLSSFGMRLARQHGVPYVYSPRGTLSEYRLHDRGLSKACFLRFFERRVIGRADALHALSLAECDELAKQGGDRSRMQIIPNCVVAPDASDLPDKTAARRQLGVPRDATVVLFISQLHAIKGLDLLIEAAGSVLPDRPDLYLLIAGPDAGYGAKTRELLKQAGLAQRSQLLGHVADQRKRAAFAAADLFSLPSYAEGMPNAALEASAMGLPVLLSEACHLPAVEMFGAGRIVPPEREALTEALRLMCQSDDLSRMGERGQQMVASDFSVTRLADQLEHLYATIAGQANHSDPPAQPSPSDRPITTQ